MRPGCLLTVVALLLLGLLAAAPARSEGPFVVPSNARRIRLEAGEFAVLRGKPDGGWVVERAPPAPAELPEAARRAVARAPAWLRDDLRDQLGRLLLVPVRLPAGIWRIAFADVTGDGRDDLLALGENDAVEALAGPRWTRIEKVDRSRLPGDLLTADSVLQDVTGDGIPDLVRVDDEGAVLVRRGRGVPGAYGHLRFRREPEVFFGETAGTAVRPAVAGENLVLGDLDGRISWYLPAEHGGWTRALELPDGPVPARRQFRAPALADLNGDRRVDLVAGRADGRLSTFLAPEAAGQWRSSDLLEGLAAGEFSSPALADLDGDGDVDLLCGDREGRILLFRNVGSATEPRFERDEGDAALAAIDVGDSSAPAAGDVDGDGDVDLVVGNQAGEIRLFLGPDWTEDEDAFRGQDVGEFAAPAIRAAAPGRPVQVVVGTLDGDVLLYERAAGAPLRFVERDSWRFVPDQEAKDLATYYARMYFPEEEPLLAPEDRATLDAYASLIDGAPARLVDEVAYAVARTPGEVLRAMARLGEASLLLENAKAVYEMAEKVAYARIVEKEDATTLAYATADGTFVEAPREVYYDWVVEPRILYEIPCRVDATWWDVSAEARGMTDSAWWKRECEPDVHAPTEQAVFWRPAIALDARFGFRLVDRAAGARTLREALLAVNAFVSCGPGLMRFGYETQDMQPWLIYAKHYGSCGEHSIVAAACARTMLIPATVVTDRGEDHQWNEWWDTDGRWHHWDASGASVDTPWGSTEGRRHEGKTVSSVTSWRSDDRLAETTTTVFSPEADYTASGSGYTDVADVTVRVEDPAGRPVDGALVLVRSHWERRNMIAVWGYTDGRGKVRFGLGHEPNGGYTIEALTPLGSAGVRSFPVEESRSDELTLRTPERKPGASELGWVEPAPTVAPGESLLGRLRRAELRAPSPITGARYRIGSYMTDVHGYRGTRGTSVPVDPGELAEVLVFSPAEYEKFLAARPCTPARRTTLAASCPWESLAVGLAEPVVVISNLRALLTAVEVEVAWAEEVRPPFVSLEGEEERTAPRGGKVVLEGAVENHRGDERLFVRSAARGGEMDVTDALDRETGRFRIELDTGAGGPWPEGDYVVVVGARTEDAEATASVLLHVTPARRFPDQRIRQDDPDDPLKGKPWILGPFDLDGTDRFFLARTSSLAEGFDCDVHLYRDKNGNGRIDGAEERVASSTSPTATERIYLESPPAGTYWLLSQGWKVEGEVASLDVEVFPEGTPRAVVDLESVGRIATRPARLAARFLPFAQVDPAGVVVRLDGAEVTGGASVTAEGFGMTVPGDLATDVPHDVAVTARHRSGREETRTWSFHVDTRPPALEILAPEADARVEEKVTIRVRATDEGPPPGVAARIANGPEMPLGAVKDAPGELEIELDATGWPEGETFVWLAARDAAGNETERVVRLRR